MHLNATLLGEPVIHLLFDFDRVIYDKGFDLRNDFFSSVYFIQILFYMQPSLFNNFSFNLLGYLYSPAFGAIIRLRALISMD